MHRLVLTLALSAVAVLFAGQALAFQCPKLVAQIDAATATRYDPAAADAKIQAMAAAQLHKDGKHADAEKLAKATLEKLK